MSTKDENREGYARRKADAGDGIHSEPRTYGPAHPEHSYFQDLALSVTPMLPDSREAAARLRRHSQEVEVEAQTDRSGASGRGLREINRGGQEVRAMSSVSASGGSFVSPEWLTGQFALYRSANASFLNQTTNLPLPEYGLTVDVPSFTGTTTVAQTGENTGVSEGDPTGTAIAASLVNIAGQVTISQQLYDRGGMSGLAFDEIVGRQIMAQSAAAEDVYVINQALANAGTVPDSTAYTAALFYQDIAKAREILTDTAGVRMAATHVFSTTDLFSYVTRQVDSSLRPIVTPDSAALVAANNDPEWAAWTGIHLPAALRWYTDDNIPATGSNTQIIVAKPDEVFTFDGDHTAYAYPETNATTLSVVVGLRSYVGVVVRFPKAIAAISGATYPTTLV